MLPPSHGCHPEDASACCTTLFEIGGSILEVGLEAINDSGCYPDDCSTPLIEGFVTLGRAGGYPLPDTLIVSLLSLAPSPRSQDQHGNMFISSWRARWQVRLLESGWVTFLEVGDEEVEPAPPDLIHANARHAYSHGEQLFRAVAGAVLDRKIEGACRDQSCYASVEDLVPIEPEGGQCGWQFVVVTEVDLSRGCSES